MNCPSCNRPNAEDLNYCDYCGTPLSAPSPGKRKTEFEPVPAAGPVRKRVTEFEPAAEPAVPQQPAGAGPRVADPFDPFGVPAASANRPAAAPARPAPSPAAAANAASAASTADSAAAGVIGFMSDTRINPTAGRLGG